MSARPCPVCGKPAVAEFRPFCSAHCADVDLNRWLSGLYAIADGGEADDESGNPRPDETTHDP